jgi:hypothetical protein
MPTPTKPWPRHAKEQREETQACAEEAAVLLDQAEGYLAEATTSLLLNHNKAEVQIAKAQTLLAQARVLQERIQRLMIEAQIGV